MSDGIPEDWTKTRYQYDDHGNPTLILELNEPEVFDDGRATEITYKLPTPAEEDANILNRPKRIFVYATRDNGNGEEVADSSSMVSCTEYGYGYNPEQPAVLTSVSQGIYSDYYYYGYGDGYCAGSGLDSTTSFDDFGNVKQSEGAAGNYRVKYDSLYHTFPTTTIYQLGWYDEDEPDDDHADLVASAAYDPGLGLTQIITDVNGAVTEYHYDAFGRVITVATPAAGAVTGYGYLYDDTGLTLTTLAREDDADHYFTTRQRYNGLGQLLGEENDGEDETTIRVAYEYQQGRLLQTSVPYTGTSPDLWTTYQYDDLNRLTAVIHPDSTVRQTQYTGWSGQRVIDENDHATDYFLDAWGRVKQAHEYTGTLTGGLQDYAATTYTYDALNNLTSVADAAGNYTDMQYDGAGQLVELDDPDQGLWRYSYRTDGTLENQMSPTSDNLSFYYDSQKRLTSIFYFLWEAGSEELLTVFEYDGSPTGRGQRTAMIDASGHTAYQYDDAGRLITETRNIDGIIYQTGFTYDPLNRVRTLIYPDGEEITYTYNHQGLLDAVSSPLAPNLVSQLNYNALSQPTLLERGGQLPQTFQYNDGTNGQPANLALYQTGVDGLNFSLTYQYDDGGQVAKVLDGKVGGVTLNLDYRYDPLNRLTTVTDNGSGLLSRSYGYNPIGNLLTKDGLTYDYDHPYSGPVHAPAAVGGMAFAYDDAGNRTGMVATGSYTYTVDYNYDYFNRLARVISATVGGDESLTQFVYDGDGQRVKRITAEGTTVTIGRHYEVFYPAATKTTLPTAPFSLPCDGYSEHRPPQLALDGLGGRYLAYNDVDRYSRCYYYIDPSGVISRETHYGGLVHELAGTGEEMAYAAWNNNAWNLAVTPLITKSWTFTQTVVATGSLALTDTAALAVEDQDTTHVVWTEMGALLYAKTVTETVTHTLVLTDAGASGPQVAVGQNGTVHIAWRQADDTRSAIYYTTIDSSTGLSSTFEVIVDQPYTLRACFKSYVELIAPLQVNGLVSG